MHPTTVFSLLAFVLAGKAWSQSHKHAPAPATTGKAVAIPVMGTDAWDDLGLVTTVHEIDPRQPTSTTTLTGTEQTTMTTTGAVQVESIIVYEPSSTVIVPFFVTSSTTTSTVTPITTSDDSSSTSTTSAPTGDPVTTVTNLRPGLNTVQFPMPSEAPVVVISAPSDSYSSGYTTETIWSSVWEPRNIAISTATRAVAYYVPATSNPSQTEAPSQTAAPTVQSSGASTAPSGVGVIVMAGVGALAACFMMF